MAMSIEERFRIAGEKARAQDRANQELTARVIANAKKHSSPTPAQVDAAAQATMSQNRSSPQPGALTESLMERATGVRTMSQNNLVNPRLPEREAEKPKVSAVDWLGSKAGEFNRGVTGALDAVANALPTIEGKIFDVAPEGTFTGQLLKPLTDVTGKLHEWTTGVTEGLNQKVDAAIGDNKALKIASDVGGSVFTALPNAILAVASGGMSVPAQLGTQTTGIAATTTAALQKMASNPTFWSSAVQNLGSGYNEAKANGAAEDEALAAAAMSAMFNSIVEVGGGVETLPGELRGVDLSTGQKAMNWLKSMVDEGKEEVVQGVIQNMTEKAVFDEDKSWFSTTDEGAVLNPGRMATEFGLGAAAGGILSGGQILADSAIRGIEKRNGAVNMYVSGEDMVSQMAQDLMGNKNTPAVEAEAESTSVNTDPAQHTPQEQAVIEDYQNAVDEGMVQFAQGVTNGSVAPKSRYQLKPVSNRAADDILRITGVDTHGFSTVIEGRMVDHIIKRHGESGTADRSMQDVNDLGRIQYVIDNYDSVSDAGTSKAYTTNKANGKPGNAKTVVFEKAVNGTYYVVEAVPDTKAKTTFVVSAYMAKNGYKKTGAEQLTDVSNDTPVFTPESGFAQTPESSIPTNTENVNGSVGDMGAKPAMGAADYGFSPYSNYQNTQSDFLPEGANAARPVDMPATDPTGKNTRRFASNAAGAQGVPNRGVDQIEQDFMDGKYGYEVKGDKQAVEKASALLEGKGFDYAYAQTVERLQDMKNLKQTVVDAQLLITRAYQDSRDADAAELCLLLAESGTEFGQAVQAYSIFRKLSPEGQLEGVRRAVDRINEKISSKNKSFAGIEISNELEQKYREAASQEARDAVMEEIYEYVGKQIPTTFAEAANQWRYTAMLFNPSTHAKNISNNFAMMAVKVLGKDTLGAGLEAGTNAVIGAANKITKGKIGNKKIERTKSILNVFSKKDQNLMRTAWADFENVEDDIKGIGKNKDNAMGKIGEHRDYWKLNDPQSKVAKAFDATFRAAENVPKLNSKAMDKEDQWFSRPDYAISLAGYMKANNLTEITPEARLYAIKEAQKATFRDANAVSDFAKRMGNTNSKLWNGIVNTIFPFKGTPANVGVRAVEYSPAGFLTTIGKAVKASRDGTFKAADFIDDLSANLVGSGLAAAGYFLAQNGWLRATGVGDEKEKDAQREAGYKDNSFTLFGYSVPETLFTSASTPMFVGAALYEALATKAMDGDAYTIDEVLQALSATADPLVGQTMLEGLNDVLYAVRSSSGGEGGWITNTLVNVAGNYLASYIPSLLSRVSSAVDGVGRETYKDKNKPLPGLQKEVQDLMMKTPLRTKLPEKVDNYGRVQENWLSDSDTQIGRALGMMANIVTPTYPSRIRTTDVEAALQDVYRSGADVSDKKIFQTDAPKNITVDGKNVNLTAEQYEQLEKIRGNNTTEYQSGLQSHALYADLDDAIKVAATDKMHEFIDQVSKSEMGLGYEPDNWVSELADSTPEEVARVVIGKALDSVGGYGDQPTEDMYRKQIYDPAWSVVDGEILDKAMEYATAFNDAEAKEKMGYAMETDWMLETKAMNREERADYFIGKAVDSMAKKAGDGKYDGLEKLLESGQITGDAALLAMPDGAVDAYNQYLKRNSVSAEEWVDVYGYMNALDGSSKEKKEKTLDYISTLEATPAQKTAFAQALYTASPDYYRSDAKIPNDWLLYIGADDSAITSQFSTSQRGLYNQYIKGTDIDMGDYLDIRSYRYGSGDEIKHDQEEVVAKIKSSGYSQDDQIRIFLSIGYSENSVKKFWK